MAVNEGGSTSNNRINPLVFHMEDIGYQNLNQLYNKNMFKLVLRLVICKVIFSGANLHLQRTSYTRHYINELESQYREWNASKRRV